MRVAVAGKGGTGKTTISGTLSRVLAHRKRSVLAIDADSNPNLHAILGISYDVANDIKDLPRDLLERRTDEEGDTSVVFAADPEEILDQFGVRGPEGVRLVVMGKVGHAGAG